MAIPSKGVGCRSLRQALLKVLSRRLPALLGAMWRRRAPSLRRAAFLGPARCARHHEVEDDTPALG